MEARIESDIAYIKAAVSNYAQRDAHCASLDARIDRVNEELRQSRSRIFELELFQSSMKGALSGLAGVAVILVIGLIVGAIAHGPHHANDAPPNEEAPEQAGTTHSGG